VVSVIERIHVHIRYHKNTKVPEIDSYPN